LQLSHDTSSGIIVDSCSADPVAPTTVGPHTMVANAAAAMRSTRHVLPDSLTNPPGVLRSTLKTRMIGGKSSLLSEEQIDQWPTSFSPDDTLLAFYGGISGSDQDIWVVPVDGSDKAQVIVDDPGMQRGGLIGEIERLLRARQ